jgi:hypothetical protein
MVMETLLDQGHGKASCPAPRLSWRTDGFLYGGSGGAHVGATYDRGCASTVFQLDSVLQPCCRPMREVLGGMLTSAPKNSTSARALAALQKRADGLGGGRATFALPSEEAWKAFESEAAAANKTLTPGAMDSLISYLFSPTEVTDVIDMAAPVRTALSAAADTERQAVCPKGTNATLTFAYDTLAAARAFAPGGMQQPPTSVAAPVAAPAAAAGVPQLPGAMPAASPQRRLLQTKLPTTGAGLLQSQQESQGSSNAGNTSNTGAAASGLSLPTQFGGPVRRKDPSNILTSRVLILDGAAAEEPAAAGGGIPVANVVYACDATLFFVPTVPLPCNFLNRTAPVLAAPSAASKDLALPAPATGVSNATGPGGAAASAATAAAGVGSLLGTAAAAALLAAMLL